MYKISSVIDCLFFNDTSTTEIYTYCHTLSLHDALPISADERLLRRRRRARGARARPTTVGAAHRLCGRRSQAVDLFVPARRSGGVPAPARPVPRARPARQASLATGLPRGFLPLDRGGAAVCRRRLRRAGSTGRCRADEHT